MLYVAQLLLPDTRQLTTLKQLLAYKVYQFNTRWRGYQSFALALYVVALKQSLDDAGTT